MTGNHHCSRRKREQPDWTMTVTWVRHDRDMEGTGPGQGPWRRRNTLRIPAWQSPNLHQNPWLLYVTTARRLKQKSIKSGKWYARVSMSQYGAVPISCWCSCNSIDWETKIHKWTFIDALMNVHTSWAERYKGHHKPLPSADGTHRHIDQVQHMDLSCPLLAARQCRNNIKNKWRADSKKSQSSACSIMMHYLYHIKSNRHTAA